MKTTSKRDRYFLDLWNESLRECGASGCFPRTPITDKEGDMLRRVIADFGGRVEDATLEHEDEIREIQKQEASNDRN